VDATQPWRAVLHEVFSMYQYHNLNNPYSDTIITFLYGIVIVVIVLGVVGIFGYDIFWFLRNRFSKVQRAPVKVVRKHGEADFITFAFEGREAEFAVPAEVYADVDEGDEGLLTFRGEQFKRFVRVDELSGGDFVDR
jgi:hypothetical protein